MITPNDDNQIMCAGPNAISFEVVKQVPRSTKWKCQWGGPMGIVFIPMAGHEPNWFHRRMQELVFGVNWVKQ